MVPFRRNVHLIMDRDIYKKLGNQPDIEKAWKLVRCAIGEEIFRRDFVAVPQIGSARYYNQLFVFKKRLDLCSVLKLRRPRYQITNNLDNLLNIEVSAWIPQYDFSPWTNRDSSTLITEFKMELVSSPNENLHKSIEVSIKHLHIRSACPPIPGSTNLNTVSSRGSIIYIVTSVVFANYVKICVCVGSQTNVFQNRHVIPVGFKYRKYRISANGQVDAEMETALKFTDQEAMWLIPTNGPFIRNHLWDPMKRRQDGSRPIRSIMTMSTTSALSRSRLRNQNGQLIPNNNFRDNPFYVGVGGHIFINVYREIS